MTDTIDYPALIERLRSQGVNNAADALDRLLAVNERLHDVIRGYQKRLGEEHGDV